MRIICDKCSAKYAIADEKVRGKVFKIRCKKCSNIIVVRGDDGIVDDGTPFDSPGSSSPGSSSAGSNIAQKARNPSSMGSEPQHSADETNGWYLVIDGGQVGPVTADDVRSHFQRGAVNVESYIWREGFAEWLPIAAVSAFSDISKSAVSSERDPQGETVGSDTQNRSVSAEEHHEGPTESVGSDSSNEEMMTAVSGVGGSLTGDLSARLDSSLGSGEPRADLFASSARAAEPAQDRQSGGSGEAQTSGAHPEVDRTMTGQRGENSVLFSLANLQALAQGGPSASAASAPVADKTQDAAATSDEAAGSGLIDIRAMAAAAGLQGASGTTNSAGSIGVDLQPLPGIGGSSAAPVAVAALVPNDRPDRPAWLIPVLIGLGIALLVSVGGLTWVLTRGPAATPAQERVGISGNNAPVASSGTDPSKSAGRDLEKRRQGAEEGAKPVEASAQGSSAQGDKAKPKAVASDSGKSPAHARGNKKMANFQAKRSALQAKRSAKGRPEAAAAARRGRGAQLTKPKKETSDSGKDSSSRPTRARRPVVRDELDRMIDSALSTKKVNSQRNAGGSKGELPAQLSRPQVVAGMRSVKGKVRACFDRYKVPGQAQIQLKILGKGRVSSARVKGLFAGTPTGDCVSRAVRSARFPRFSGAAMSINYPFILQ